jgi:molybdopterin-guanine dinucleotide biosynthesis protein A
MHGCREVGDAVHKLIDSPFVPKKFRDALKAAAKERIHEPFRGEDGLVHLVIAEYETLCHLMINTAIGPAGYGYVFGKIDHNETTITCMGCLAEEYI